MVITDFSILEQFTAVLGIIDSYNLCDEWVMNIDSHQNNILIDIFRENQLGVVTEQIRIKIENKEIQGAFIQYSEKGVLTNQTLFNELDKKFFE